MFYNAIRQHQTREAEHRERHTQTQTIPIQPPEIALMFVKLQLPYAAMIDEISWATANANSKAVDGRSVKNRPCERVTKIKACEMTATCK